MTLLDTHNPLMGPVGMANRIGSVFVTATAAATDWNDRRVTRRALSQLSDRELDDIGLIRADIERASRIKR
ncbi:hypothetical protein FIU97_01985 [Roseivivax sp. THAF40]|uniref:DUF1127 domain-containing protein n=1 Tax=unclassified Roseivivax TaxID=2639302 RepID=UPI00126959E3|nr:MULTISPECIES: DUF1127 domain-containing protein [unclassified Roseivivax]QFS81605.1 hypothetical protein FIV09_02080 [Roseivivax sp. THAF197b]QFT45334.1 hypothetical protein FIU97_01985 [Roseivivax sp. THAF40]